LEELLGGSGANAIYILWKLEAITKNQGEVHLLPLPDATSSPILMKMLIDSLGKSVVGL
jgi:hypothetical protein